MSLDKLRYAVDGAVLFSEDRDRLNSALDRLEAALLRKLSPKQKENFNKAVVVFQQELKASSLRFYDVSASVTKMKKEVQEALANLNRRLIGNNLTVNIVLAINATKSRIRSLYNQMQDVVRRHESLQDIKEIMGLLRKEFRRAAHK